MILQRESKARVNDRHRVATRNHQGRGVEAVSDDLPNLRQGLIFSSEGVVLRSQKLLSPSLDHTPHILITRANV